MRQHYPGRTRGQRIGLAVVDLIPHRPVLDARHLYAARVSQFRHVGGDGLNTRRLTAPMARLPGKGGGAG